MLLTLVSLATLITLNDIDLSLPCPQTRGGATSHRNSCSGLCRCRWGPPHHPVGPHMWGPPHLSPLGSSQLEPQKRWSLQGSSWSHSLRQVITKVCNGPTVECVQCYTGDSLGDDFPGGDILWLCGKLSRISQTWEWSNQQRSPVLYILGLYTARTRYIIQDSRDTLHTALR